MSTTQPLDAALSGPPTPDAVAAGDAATAEKKPSFFAELRAEDWGLRAWLRLFRDLYCTFDRRTLGFSRILLGFLLLTDVLHRGRAWIDMYSSVGVLPTPLNLQRPQAWGAFSIFNAFNTPGEVRVLWVLMVINAVCLLVGYKTKVAQMAALVLHVGMNGRVLLIENGGYVVNSLLILWTMFLPMGDRFSVDALLASLKRRREATAADLNDRSDMVPPGKGGLYVSVLGLVLMVQIAAIYYFNVMHKTGPAWRNGTAVHYVLYVDRMATPIIGVLRDYVPNFLALFMTRATMAFEAAIPVLLLQPLARPWARRGVVFMMCTLHLAFGTTFVLGAFAWSCCVFSTLLFSRDDWEIASATMRRARRARTVLFDPRSGGALLVCRLLKRLDRFELFTFAAAVTVGDTPTPPGGLPLGIGIEGQTSRAGMLADLIEALPLGPTLAWIPRLPVVSGVFESALRAIEKRDVSGYFGLRVEGRAGSSSAPAEPAPADRDPRLGTALVVMAMVLLVVLALASAIVVGKTVGILMTLCSVVIVATQWARRPARERWIGALPRLPGAIGIVLAVLAVPGAIAYAVYRDEPLPGVVLVLATVGLASAVVAWITLPVLEVRALRRWVSGGLREFLILTMFAGAVNQALVELWCINKRIKVPQPESLRLLSHKMRFLQGWFMFSPNPVMDDGTVVVDALTVDGRHIDPFTGQEPHWDLSRPLGLTQIWCDYFNRIQLPANTAYREAMKDYMYRLPQRTGRPGDAIVSGDVFWVKKMNPRWGETQPYGYDRTSKLFSFENPATQPHASR